MLQGKTPIPQRQPTPAVTAPDDEGMVFTFSILLTCSAFLPQHCFSLKARCLAFVSWRAHAYDTNSNLLAWRVNHRSIVLLGVVRNFPELISNFFVSLPEAPKYITLKCDAKSSVPFLSAPWGMHVVLLRQRTSQLTVPQYDHAVLAQLELLENG